MARHRSAQINAAGRVIVALLLSVGAIFCAPPVLGPLLAHGGSFEAMKWLLPLWSATIGLGLAALLLIGGPTRWRPRLFKVTTNLVLLGLVVLFSLGLMEFGLKLAVPKRFHVKSAEFEYDVALNDDGFRDKPFSPQKVPHTYRIHFIGDSFVYGTGVRESRTIPTLIEAELASRAGIQAEVYNLGVPGVGPNQYAKLAEDFADHAPDLVLLGFYVDNDVQHAPPLAPLARLVRTSRLFALLDRGWLSYGEVDHAPRVEPKLKAMAKRNEINPGLIGRGRVPDNYEFYQMRTDYFRGAPYPRKSLLRVREVYKNIPFLLVIFPSKYQVSAKYLGPMKRLGFKFEENRPIPRDLQDAMLSWAKASQIDALDLLPIFQAEAIAHYHPLDDHLNEAGNTASTRAIVDWIIEQGALK